MNRKRSRSSSSSSSSSNDADRMKRQKKIWDHAMATGIWPGMTPAGGSPPGGPPMRPQRPQHPQRGGSSGDKPAWPQGQQGSNYNRAWEDQGRRRDGRGRFHDRETEPKDIPLLSPPEDVPIFLEPAIEENVLVPKALIRKIVGKQGANVIEIKAKSGCYKVDARDWTNDPVQVKVAGSAEAVKKARALIKELLDAYDFVEIPKAKIGMVIGLKGAQVNEIQAETGTKIDVDFTNDPCKCFINGLPENIESAKRILLTIAMQIEDEESEYLDLPKESSVALIGAAGSRIRELQEQSGARIDVDKTGRSCRVRLTGDKEQVANAKQLIIAEVNYNLQQAKQGPGAPHQPMIIPPPAMLAEEPL